MARTAITTTRTASAARTASARRRTVESIAACPAFGTVLSLADSAAWKPASDSFSLLGWTRRNVASGDCYLFGRSNAGAYILVYTDAVASWRYAVSDGVSAANIGTALKMPLMRWTQFAAILDRDAALLRFYQDGELIASPALGAVASLSFDAVTTYIGGSSTGQGNDFAWYNGKALTQDEVRSHYFDGVFPTAGSSTRVIWRINEGADTSVASEPAGYTGTLSAANWSTDTRCKARTAA